MWGFLAPAALFGLTLLGIPIILHLLKPRKVRQTPFTSLRWLRESQHRISRRVRWHQVLLFLLRAGLVTALVLALARPFFSSVASSGKADRFVIVDFSRSMQYESDQDKTAMAEARAVAAEVAGQAGPGDRTTIVLGGAKPQPLGPLTSDPGRYVARLRTAPAPPVDAPVTKALSILGALSDNSARERIELYFVTDNYADTWNTSDIERFLQGVRQPVDISVVDLGPSLTTNAWIADARLVESADQERRTIRVQLSCTGGQPQRRTLRLSRVGARQSATRNVELKPGAVVEAEFEISTESDLAGNVAEVALEPADRLPSDDKFLLNLDTSTALNVLVVEASSTHVAELQPGHHLRTALQALAESQRGAVQIVRRNPAASLSQEIARADLIFLVDVPTLNDTDVTRLSGRVAAGAGLVMFLGPAVDSEFYNSRLAQPLSPQQALLPLQLSGISQVKNNAERKRLADVDWSHPLFAHLADPSYGNLSQAGFAAYHRLQVSSSGRTLARIGDVPFVVERTFGAGRVLVFNTTASDVWSDLPRRSIFVPLVDNAMRLLTRGPQRRTFAIGEEVTLPLASTRAANPLVVAPSGKQLHPVIRTVAGHRLLQIPSALEAGVYQVYPDGAVGGQSYPFVVQPSGPDSLLVKTDPSLLRSWWSPAKVQIAGREAKSGKLDLGSRRYFLEPWLVLLACAFMLGEMFLVHWLCPKANPRVLTQSPVMTRAHTDPRYPGIESAGAAHAAAGESEVHA